MITQVVLIQVTHQIQHNIFTFTEIHTTLKNVKMKGNTHKLNT